MECPKSHISIFHVQCFAKNPCVREEKSNSFPDCEESDESEDAFCLPATGILGILPLLGALFPIAYGLQHKNERVSYGNDAGYKFNYLVTRKH